MGRAGVHEVPHELIAMRAYRKWEMNCEEGRSEHGHNEEDWFKAEAEIREIWENLESTDLQRFSDWINENPIDPSHDKVAVRAYFLSKAQPECSPEQAWKTSERAERTVLFAAAFDTFQANPTSWTPSVLFG